MKILFISHDANRTGAPLVLLKFLKWLKSARPDIHFDVLLKRNGPLRADFEAIAATWVWEHKGGKHKKKSFVERLAKRVLRYDSVLQHKNALIRRIRDARYDLLYVNSIAGSDVAIELLQDIQIPVILHVHELEMAIDLYCDRKAFDMLKPKVAHFIAVSKVVRENLLQRHHIPENKISLVYEFVWASPQTTQSRETLKEALGIPENGFVVGGSGTLEWRKGADLFVQIAKQVIEREEADRPVCFLWLGGGAARIYRLQILHDIEILEIKDRFRIVGESPNPSDFFQLFDLFLLPSREDPFPLVAIENGAMGNPIVCFDRQVGTAEFIDSDCGAVVPYLDTREAANAIVDFYHDKQKLDKARSRIREKVSGYAVEAQGVLIVNEIEAVYQAR